MSGLMGEPMMVSGRTTKWRALEPSPGPMAGGTKASTKMTKSTAMVNILNLMESNI